MVFTRKKQQLEQAVQIVPGLKKNMDRGSLLSILQQQKKANADAHMQAGQAVPKEDPLPGNACHRKGQGPERGDHRISLGLFREGVPVAEIAARRGMAMTTIEGHLASFILSGEIDIRELVPEHKKDKILSAIRELGASSVNPIKPGWETPAPLERSGSAELPGSPGPAEPGSKTGLICRPCRIQSDFLTFL